MKLTIRAPATSANLGPGFDCLGLALDLWATVTVEPVEGRSRPEGAVTALVQQGVRAAFEAAKKRSPGVAVAWDGAIPLARGLGGSAALRAAGLLGGNALLDGRLTPDELLELGTRLETHPDNMAPAIFGGLQVVARSDRGLLHVGATLPPGLKVVLLVPDFEMPTQESRRRLPAGLSREDAVFNAGRVALLIAALGAGRFDLLDEATQDRLHQPVRGEIFPGLAPIMTAAKAAGAAAAYLSGGGSTVAAFLQEPARPEALEGRADPASSPAERVARLMTRAAAEHGYIARAIVTAPTARGAHLVE